MDKSYWNSRYENQQTGWDIGYISTPIKEYADQLKNKNMAILIPGCGNAYEAEYLLQQDFTNITLVDIAPAAIEAVRKRLIEWEGQQLRIIEGDFFELNEKFDLIIEQTFFCALAPSLREAYTDKMFDLLNDEGKVVGLLFNRSFEGGPPYGGNKEEYIQIFRSKFSIELMEVCTNSIAPRAGAELFFILTKKTW
jgi:methyl halide transferase